MFCCAPRASHGQCCSEPGLFNAKSCALNTQGHCLFLATALPTLGSPVSCWGSHGNALRLVPSLPWTVRTNVRMASPAVLLTLQLYKPLSNT